MANNSFGGVSGMGMAGQRSMPGLGVGVQPGGSGIGLGNAGAPLNGALNAGGRLGAGSGGFGAMQGAAQASYNPSGEILAMINKGQNIGLGLPPSQPLNMAGTLPPSLSQPGLPPGAQGGPGLGLGMPPPDLGGGGPPMGGVPASPSFDMSDFPSLGRQPQSQPPPAVQHFRSQGGGLGQVPQPVQSEFAIQSEDFPALPGAAPASSGAANSYGDGGGLGGVEAVLGLSKDAAGGGGGGSDGLSLPSGAPGSASDRYGLMGLLSVIRMTDQDVNTLSLGTDLTTLGLNLNSAECLYATFASPWADSPAQRDPEFSLPQCYYMQPPALKTGHFSKFQLETLFYIFYNMPRDTLQAYAATELYNRDWRYHKDLKLWFTKASRQGSADTQKGQYIYFDINEWKKKLFTQVAVPNDAGAPTDDDAAHEAAAGP